MLGLQRYPNSFSFLSSYLKEKFKEVDIYICLNENTTETFVQNIDILHIQNLPKQFDKIDKLWVLLIYEMRRNLIIALLLIV